MTSTEKNADKNSEKLKALRLTIDKIDKDYGKGSVSRNFHGLYRA